MNEDEWERCTDPAPMLDFLAGRANERKLMLFAVACCRRVWDLMTDPGHRQAVEAAERRADGLLSEEEFGQAMEPVVAAWSRLPDHRRGRWEASHYMIGAARHLGAGMEARDAASYAARGRGCRVGSEGGPAGLAAVRTEEAAQCGLLRDLFGYPSSPYHFDPAWLTGQGAPAVELAKAIHRAGRFDALPELTDVLERSECRDRAVLDHCRGPGPHARGCWVVDALAGHEPAVRVGLRTAADWQGCDDPEPLLRFLYDKGTVRKWRLFAVACCRRIDRLTADGRSRAAVEVAARHADAAASEEELAAAREAARQAQDEAHREEYAAEARADFCITPEYAAVCCRGYATAAARDAVRRDPRTPDPGQASPDPGEWMLSCTWTAWAFREEAFTVAANWQHDDVVQAIKAADAAWRAERRGQCELLRDLFGAFLGPPGQEGRWLPCWLSSGPQPYRGDEQWCLLPTPRKLVLRPEWLAWNAGTVLRLAQAIYEEEAFDRLPVLADALIDAGCDDDDVLKHLREPGRHARGCWALDLCLGLI